MSSSPALCCFFLRSYILVALCFFLSFFFVIRSDGRVGFVCLGWYDKCSCFFIMFSLGRCLLLVSSSPRLPLEPPSQASGTWSPTSWASTVWCPRASFPRARHRPIPSGKRQHRIIIFSPVRSRYMYVRTRQERCMLHIPHLPFSLVPAPAAGRCRRNSCCVFAPLTRNKAVATKNKHINSGDHVCLYSTRCREDQKRPCCFTVAAHATHCTKFPVVATQVLFGLLDDHHTDGIYRLAGCVHRVLRACP